MPVQRRPTASEISVCMPYWTVSVNKLGAWFNTYESRKKTADWEYQREQILLPHDSLNG